MFKEQGRQYQENHRPRSRAAEQPTALAPILKAGLFVALALGTIALSGCDHSGPMQTEDAAWQWSGPVDASGIVNIRNTAGEITVEPSADNQVHVVAATRWSKGDWRKDVDFRAVSAANSVTICAVWGRGECSADDYESRLKRGRFRSDAKVAFTVKVPAGVRVDAWTLSGDLAIRASAPVKAHAIDGNIKVGTAVGPVNAETVNGDVDIRMTTIGDDAGPVVATTKNGDAAAWVPEITNGRIEASTLNGAVGSDFGDLMEGRGDRRSFETSIGTGARKYSVQSMNGSAYLRLINADGSVASGGSASTTSRARAAAISIIEEPRAPMARRPELKVNR